MPRKYAKSNESDFVINIESHLEELNLSGYYKGIRGLVKATPKMEKDLNKVKFSWENVTYETNSKMHTGYHSIGDLNFLGVSAGGDWEMGLYFIIYDDGESLRAYIPKEGNNWNLRTKRVYGNNSQTRDEWALKIRKKDARDLDEFDVIYRGRKDTYSAEWEDYKEDGEIFKANIPWEVDWDKIVQDIEKRFGLKEQMSFAYVTKDESDMDVPYFIVTPTKHWKETGYLSDEWHDWGQTKLGFASLCDACFEFTGESSDYSDNHPLFDDQAREILLGLGFKEDKTLKKFL